MSTIDEALEERRKLFKQNQKLQRQNDYYEKMTEGLLEQNSKLEHKVLKHETKITFLENELRIAKGIQLIDSVVKLAHELKTCTWERKFAIVINPHTGGAFQKYIVDAWGTCPVCNKQLIIGKDKMR